MFSRLLINVDNSFLTCRSWLKDVLIYNKESLGLFYGLYVALTMFKVKYKKLIILSCVWISILRPTFFKVFITFFLHDPFFAHSHYVIRLTHHHVINEKYLPTIFCKRAKLLLAPKFPYHCTFLLPHQNCQPPSFSVLFFQIHGYCTNLFTIICKYSQIFMIYGSVLLCKVNCGP